MTSCCFNHEHDNRNFESQIVPRCGKLFLLIVAIGGTVCSWMALNECEFLIFQKDIIPSNQQQQQNINKNGTSNEEELLVHNLFDAAIEANVGLLRYEITRSSDETNDNVESSSSPSENSNNSTNNNNNTLLRRLNVDVLAGGEGQCTKYPDPFGQFKGVSKYMTIAQCFGMIAFVFGCCAIVSALTEACICYNELSKYPVIVVFVLATIAQSLTFLILKDSENLCGGGSGSDELVVTSSCNINVGRGFIFSIIATCLYCMAIIIECVTPRVDPICRDKFEFIDETTCQNIKVESSSSKNKNRNNKDNKNSQSNNESERDETHDDVDGLVGEYSADNWTAENGDGV